MPVLEKGTLLKRHSPLAPASEQLRIIDGPSVVPSFDDLLEQNGLSPLFASGIEVFQINLGKRCNQVCGHCHVDAGPDRLEMMTQETAAECIRTLRSEEHTSELQSLAYLVCRLLLEKKK